MRMHAASPLSMQGDMRMHAASPGRATHVQAMKMDRDTAGHGGHSGGDVVYQRQLEGGRTSKRG